MLVLFCCPFGPFGGIGPFDGIGPFGGMGPFVGIGPVVITIAIFKCAFGNARVADR